MTNGPEPQARRRTLRTRILLIAWVPSLALVLIGGGVAAYLAVQSSHIKSVADVLAGGAAAGPFIPAIESEMRLTGQALAEPDRSRAALVKQRAAADQALAAFAGVTAEVQTDYTAPAYNQTLADLGAAMAAIPAHRQAVDAGELSLLDATGFYAEVVRLIGQADGLISGTAPDGESALAVTVADRYFEMSSQMAHANALAYQAFSSTGMTEPEYQEFVANASTYRAAFKEQMRVLPAHLQAKAQALVDSPAWEQQLQVERAVLGSRVPTPKPAASSGSGTGTGAGTGTGTGTGEEPATPDDTAADPAAGTAGPAAAAPVGRVAKLPVDRDVWAAASEQVYKDMGDIAVGQSIYGGAVASDVAQERITQAAVVGGVLLLVGLAILVLTTRESNKLVGRLRRLRSETLDLAHNRLPAIVTRLREGDKLDAAEELPPLDHGRDEIGEVADAFTDAQRVAVRAAIQEAETRAGLRAVFLNIARRSQVIVHRQLSVLERAERFQEDPEQLKLLFELDHLSTRARRNAENLVILGGGQPGRQWRNSVALLQVVRGAISESEDYARVSVANLPRRAINGTAVADVVHLLAEVVDNATSFSPPMSRVEVRGNMVGRGLVIEIEDQGLGIPAEQLDQLNEMMQDPPDFHVMALREEPRLGMFVVAQLAKNHGIRVTLTPSPAYGGTRVVVLLPNELLDANESQTSLITGERPALESPQSPVPVAPVPLAPVPLAPVPPAPVALAPVTPLAPVAPLTPAPAPSLHSIHERMAFEGDLFADSSAPATGEFGLPRRESPATGEFGLPRREPAGPRRSTDRTMDTPPRGFSTVPAYETAPAPVLSSAGNGRPELPRRNRQSHLSDRLRTSATGGQPPIEPVDPSAVDPEQARSRMGAFQRGTRQGRTAQPDDEA